MLSLYAMVFVLSLVSCEAIRRFAASKALLDQPNERSLHAVPKPRLGGVAIALWTLAAGAVLALRGDPELRLLVAAGAIVAGVGLIDDLRPIATWIRLVAQMVVAAGFVWLG